LLLRSIVDNSKTDRIKETLFHISNNKEIRIGDLAKKLSVNESTLYRLFIDQVGQSPKAFLRTIRFRNVLDKLIDHNRNKFSELAYNHNYADQSHLIKILKKLRRNSGAAEKKTRIQQEELAWIYTEG
jgi:AraC-like DNA-binding protein